MDNNFFSNHFSPKRRLAVLIFDFRSCFVTCLSSSLAFSGTLDLTVLRVAVGEDKVTGRNLNFPR